MADGGPGPRWTPQRGRRRGLASTAPGRHPDRASDDGGSAASAPGSFEDARSAHHPAGRRRGRANGRGNGRGSNGNYYDRGQGPRPDQQSATAGRGTDATGRASRAHDFMTKEERDVLVSVPDRCPDEHVRSRIDKVFDLTAAFAGATLALPADPSAYFAPHAVAFSLPALETAKSALNRVKGSLNQMDLTAWGRHTNFTNPAADVQFELRRRVDPEMCTVAFCKLYEMLVAFDLVPQTAVAADGSVTTYHLCEAPGAFVAATNHYLRTASHLHSAVTAPGFCWRWTGLSLNPWSEANTLDAMIDDDRLIRETLDHWFFGPTNTGDIMDADNIAALWARAEAQGRPHLVTGDGSINCVDRPAEQEATVAWLHLCEAVAGLGCLAPGGALVIKTFTHFEHQSVALLYVLAAVFDKLAVCKPFTSKQGNSETYIVGRGFRGMDPRHLSTLLEHIRRGEAAAAGRALLPLPFLPTAFTDAVTECAHMFARCQAAAITRNIRLFAQRNDRSPEGYEQWKRIEQQIRRTKIDNANTFVEVFQLKPLEGAFRLAHAVHMDGSWQQRGHMVQQERESRGGSFIERRQRLEDERIEIESLKADVRKRPRPDDEENGSSRPDARTPQQLATTTTTTVAATAATAVADVITQASPTDASNPPSKRARASSDAVPTFAERQMARLGYQPGRGLGANLQGIATPVEAYGGPRNAGLGFGTEIDSGLPPALAEQAVWLLPALLPAPAPRHTAVVVGAALDRVRLSRFVSDITIKDALKFVDAIATYPAEARAALQARLEPWARLRTRLPDDPRVRSSLVFGLYLVEHALGIAAALAPDVARSGICTLPLGPAAAACEPDVTLFWARHHPDARRVTAVDVFGPRLDLASAPVDRRVAAVVADCLAFPDPDGTAERPIEIADTAWKRTVVVSIAAALRVLAADGLLILRIGPCLTRFAAGIPYLLGTVFHRVTPVKPSGFLSTSPEQLLVASGFVGDHDRDGAAAVDRLARILADTLTQLAALPPGRDVVELVTPPVLMEAQFLRTLNRLNGVALGAHRDALHTFAVALKHTESLGPDGAAPHEHAADLTADALLSVLPSP